MVNSWKKTIDIYLPENLPVDLHLEIFSILQNYNFFYREAYSKINRYSLT